jgi:hypothetical protein
MKQPLLIFLLTCCSVPVIASFATFYFFFLSSDPDDYKVCCLLLGSLQVSKYLTLLSVTLINIFTAESWQEKKADNTKAFFLLLASNIVPWTLLCILATFIPIEQRAELMGGFLGSFLGTYIISAGVGLIINIVTVFFIRMVRKVLSRNRTSVQDQQ